MTTENQRTIPQESISELPSDNELFAGEVHEDVSEHQVFAGNEDFFRSLMDSAGSAMTQEPAGPRQPEMGPVHHKRFSTIQKVLAASIVLVAVMLLYALLKSPSTPVVGLPPARTAQQEPPPESVAVESAKTLPGQMTDPKPTLEPTQPFSLNVADSFYLNGDYDQALLVYENLRQSLPARPEQDLVSDFLRLRMALCMEKTGGLEQADRLFRMLSNSRSCVVKVVANYHCSLLGMQKKQYLTARTAAYQAIALIDAIDFDIDWALSLKQDCYFLAAEAITRKVLSLCDTDKDLPENLWSEPHKANDPFAKLNETQLRTFLSSGSQQVSKALLGPEIQHLNQQRGSPRYIVVCHSAPLEELLSRFATNAGLDVHWTPSSNEIWIRKRAVKLYLPEATTQQTTTVASGCVGLLARLNEKEVVDIFDPAECSYVSEQISLLTTEAISLWQEFLLRFDDDPRIANVHFALGLLQAQEGEVAESIAEYKLVSNRFSRSSLAPFALLNSSKLKASLRNYPGARQDLKQLVEQHPDTQIAGRAYLYLADTTAQTGLKTEAARLYHKVYNLSLFSESQTAAALGAGKCFYQTEDYESAEKWLTRYIRLAEDRKNKDLYSACFLLGKTKLALGNSEGACDAFQYALAGGPSQLSREEYIETISALVEGYIQQEHFVQALDMLEDIHLVMLSQKESIEILLLKSRLLRTIGLVDKAIAILGDRAEYTSDLQLKAKTSLELADCYVNKGNLELARGKLTEVLVSSEPGPLAQEIAVKLADVCLKLGHDSHAISVCSQLLRSEPSEQIKRKALDLLATAYRNQKIYDRAALAVLGQWK